MGTGYDCFDPMSFTASPDINGAQRQRRNQLLIAMRKQGFRNYPREWWHFTFRYGQTEYRIEVQNGGEPSKPEFRLEDDGKSHTIRVFTGPRPSRKMPDTSSTPSVLA